MSNKRLMYYNICEHNKLITSDCSDCNDINRNQIRRNKNHEALLRSHYGQ